MAAPAVQIPDAGTSSPEDASAGEPVPTKLFVGGISRRTTTKQLREYFSKYGKVLDCVAMRQPDGRPRGFGYVTLESKEAADECLSNAQKIDDRIVDIKPAMIDVPPKTQEGGAIATTSLEAGKPAQHHPMLWPGTHADGDTSVSSSTATPVSTTCDANTPTRMGVDMLHKPWITGQEPWASPMSAHSTEDAFAGFFGGYGGGFGCPAFSSDPFDFNAVAAAHLAAQTVAAQAVAQAAHAAASAQAAAAAAQAAVEENRASAPMAPAVEAKPQRRRLEAARPSPLPVGQLQSQSDADGEQSDNPKAMLKLPTPLRRIKAGSNQTEEGGQTTVASPWDFTGESLATAALVEEQEEYEVDVAKGQEQKICTFFLKGNCGNGYACRFSHEVSAEDTWSAGLQSTTFVHDTSSTLMSTQPTMAVPPQAMPMAPPPGLQLPPGLFNASHQTLVTMPPSTAKAKMTGPAHAPLLLSTSPAVAGANPRRLVKSNSLNGSTSAGSPRDPGSPSSSSCRGRRTKPMRVPTVGTETRSIETQTDDITCTCSHCGEVSM